MATLKDRLIGRRAPTPEAERLAGAILSEHIQLYAAKTLLRDALRALEQKPDAPPVLSTMQRIKFFLERHP